MDTNDPLDREIDISKLKRTRKPRGFYADKMYKDGTISIKPEILKGFDNIEQINNVLQDYLERKTA